MLALSKAITAEPQVRRLIECVKTGGTPAVISGLSGIHRAHLAAAIRAETGRRLVVVCADETECAKMGADIAVLAGEETVTLCSREYTFHNVEGVSRQSEQARIGALFKMAGGAQLVAATIDGLLQRAIPKDDLLGAVFEISPEGRYDIEELAGRFERAGYHRCDQVEGCGQYAVRGGILDFFSPAHSAPVRCEFFGDEVDSLSWFDAVTQRRTSNAPSALALPVAETLPQLY
ncbi:MAG: transcription-repair coupling factor, partial [Oscillospiraceae bacterium]|nr:transcription-repair coupling factor [Oscillospiraceae bacterium]